MNASQLYLVRRRKKSNNLPIRLAAGLAFGALATVVFTIVLGLSVVAGVYVYYSSQLPSAEEINRRTISSFETIKIYDRTGEHLLYELLPPEGGKRTMVSLHQIPEHVRYAVIALEDRSFYDNPMGVNVQGLARAVINNIRGLPIQGGSSIAQQLIRNVVMTPEERMARSYTRKVKEVVLAFELTRRYPGVEGKDQILEGYLNMVFYGRWSYGIEAAAENYFGKSARDLTLAEAAMLAHLPNSPALNPVDAPEEAKKRQELVLDQMYFQGYITAEEAWAAKQEQLNVVSKRFEITAPHFVMYIRQLLEEKYGTDVLYRGGLNVYTTLDLDLQFEAERIAREQIAKVVEVHNAHNAAVVVLDAQTGEILTMVGSLDYFDSSIDGQVNMAISPRQPGSSFKPFTYVTAFMQGYTPATMVMDVRTSFPDDPNPPYVPENHDRKFHGPLLLREAFACSYNIPAVAMLQKVGVKNVLNTAHRMGINTLNNDFYGLSLTLGGGEVSLLDQCFAYSVFANGGVMVGEPVPEESRRPGFRELNPVAIRKIVDTAGTTIYEYTRPERRDVLRPEAAYLVTHILSDDRARQGTFGPNSIVNLGTRAAVKTGTTNDYHDAWTMGYSTQRVVGVWVGNTDNAEMNNMPGSRGAGPIWRGVMDYALKDLPVVEFPVPDGLEWVNVDRTSGLLPTQYSPSTRREVFIIGTAPTEHDNIHRPVSICRASGKLASSSCPAPEVDTQVFEFYPPEASDWVRENGLSQPPNEYCTIHGSALTSAEVAIIKPAVYSCVTGIVPIIGNARPGDFHSYQLFYGQGVSPEQWIPIGGEHGDRVDNNVLENWDASQLPDGLYSLRLAVSAGGGWRESVVPVIVDNTAPQVEIINPWEGKAFYRDDDEWVNVQVDAWDNVAMDRVEFFLNGHSLGFSTVAPFTKRWTIDLNAVPAPVDAVPATEPVPDATPTLAPTAAPVGGRRLVFHVVGYDSAGNRTESKPVSVSVGAKKPEPKTPEPGAG